MIVAPLEPCQLRFSGANIEQDSCFAFIDSEPQP